MLRSLFAFVAALALVVVAPATSSAITFSAVANSFAAGSGPDSISIFINDGGSAFGLNAGTIFFDANAAGTTFTSITAGSAFPGSFFNTANPSSFGINPSVIGGVHGSNVLLATLGLDLAAGGGSGFIDLNVQSIFFSDGSTSSSSQAVSTLLGANHLAAVTAIPEPGTAVLLGMSLSGLAFLRKRRQA